MGELVLTTYDWVPEFPRFNHVPLGPAAPWVLGALLGRRPRRVKE